MKKICEKLNLRFDRSEISGSLGDLGVFLPLATGMASRCGMNLGHILFFAGAMNLGSGILFGIPVAVQPMKVIAAVAIAEGLSASLIAAAGIISGLIILILGVTGFVEYLGRVIPKAVVRGLQLTIGIKLAMSGLKMVHDTGYLFAPDSVFGAIILSVLVIIFMDQKKIPIALILFGIGISIVLYNNPGVWRNLRPGWEFPAFLPLTISDFKSGFIKGTLPQIPLTILNSVVAVCALSIDLFPKRPLAPRKIAASVGIMNLLACPFGGMPMCHGAGGLAAQYRFGARTGGSVVFLGLAKIALAVTFGSSLLTIITLYPGSVLGVLLLFAGWQMAVVCRDMKAKWELISLALTTSACMAFDMAWGFAAGFAAVYLLNKIVLQNGSNLPEEINTGSVSASNETDYDTTAR